MKKKITAIATLGMLVTSIVAGSVLTTASMNVDGVACKTFSECRSLADVGSVWTIRGSWYSSGKLSVPNNGIFLVGDNAIISHASVSGNAVEMYGFEVKDSPIGINGVYWTGDNGFFHDNIVHDSGLTGIRLYTAYNTTVQNNLVYGNNRGVAGNSDGINCSNGANNSFLYNDTSTNGDDGMDVWNCPNNTIRYNNAHHNCGSGDKNGFKLGPAGGNIVEFNKASFNCKDGFASNEGRNLFTSNTSDHNGRHGFSEWCGTTCGTTKSVYTNNTSYSNGGKNFSDTTGGSVIYGSGNTTATPSDVNTPSYTPILPSFTPTTTLTPIQPTTTPTKTATITPTSAPTNTRTSTPVPTPTPYIIYCYEPCKIIIEPIP